MYISYTFLVTFTLMFRFCSACFCTGLNGLSAAVCGGEIEPIKLAGPLARGFNGDSTPGRGAAPVVTTSPVSFRRGRPGRDDPNPEFDPLAVREPLAPVSFSFSFSSSSL
jgi:hypothetical protein